MPLDGDPLRIAFPPKFAGLFRPQEASPGLPVRYRIAWGGRGGAKSRSFARALVGQAMSQKHLILCTREFQNSIADSVHRVLVGQIHDLGLAPWYDINQTSIRCTTTGSEFIFKGMNRSIQEIRSLEGVTRVWIEEAQSTSQDSWNILDPTIREPGCEIWASFNPVDPTDPIYSMFVTNKFPDAISLKVGWQDNPWFPPELDRLRRRWQVTDPESYDWVWEGECRQVSAATIFKDKAFVETFDEPPLQTRFYHGLDFGFANDPTVLMRCWIRPSSQGFGEDLMIDREAYGHGVEIDQLPDFFDATVETARTWPIKADSARPETISYLARKGYSVTAAEKWKGCVEDGIEHLKGFRRIVIHERHCPNTAREFRLYKYKVDPKTDDILPIVEGKNDHAPDATRYSLDGMIQMRGGIGVWQRLVRPHR